MKSIVPALILTILFTASAINVPLCSNGGVSLSFKDTHGNLDQTTRANLCHDKKSLFITW